jgi:hypothetical protein
VDPSALADVRPELAAAGIRFGRDYPLPIVDHAAARARALDAFARSGKRREVSFAAGLDRSSASHKYHSVASCSATTHSPLCRKASCTYY